MLDLFQDDYSGISYIFKLNFCAKCVIDSTRAQTETVPLRPQDSSSKLVKLSYPKWSLNKNRHPEPLSTIWCLGSLFGVKSVSIVVVVSPHNYLFLLISVYCAILSPTPWRSRSSLLNFTKSSPAFRGRVQTCHLTSALRGWREQPLPSNTFE